MLKRQLKKLTVITIISSLLLSLIAAGLIAYVKNASHQADHLQMQLETQECKDRIYEQLDKNMQILTTTAKLFETSAKTELSLDKIGNCLEEIDKQNDFKSIAYILKDGSSVINVADGITILNPTQTTHEYAQKAIRAAFEGENSISKMFQSAYLNQKVFVYAVPVYQEDTVVAVLVASGTLEGFTSVTNSGYVQNGQGYIHIINQDGFFLIRSQYSLVKETYENIFLGPYLTEDMKQKTKEALHNGESMFGDFEYKGEECHYYLEPLNINGWYLFCANRIWSSSFLIGNIYAIVGGVMITVAVAVNALIYMGYAQIRKSTKNLIRLAYTDLLTGADNILRFDQKFAEVPKGRQPYAVVALNVRNFKGVNDLFQKKEGDRVLCYIKNIIEKSMDKTEFFCRESADMFYLLLNTDDEAVITERINSILYSVNKTSLKYGGYSYELLLYAGIALNGDREQALVALQSIKNVHRKDIAFYNNELHEQLRQKNSIESYMHLALKNEEFKLFLQPKFDLHDDTLAGAEALVRWRRPDGSYRYPNEFIPIFERNGFCLKLDMYMLEKACQQIKKWIDSGVEPIPISVNQSIYLFLDRNYPEHLDKLVKKYEISPSWIVLEILENMDTENLELMIHQINVLHEKGFRISMDDFGSGYSSLNMLYQLKIDELKFDRGFLRKGSEDDNKRRVIILEQMIRFAERLGITTVAEGIETEHDKETMKSLRCDYGQGYFYEKPMNAKDFSAKYMSMRK